jgi:hypothetical protein
VPGATRANRRSSVKQWYQVPLFQPCAEANQSQVRCRPSASATDGR